MTLNPISGPIVTLLSLCFHNFCNSLKVQLGGWRVLSLFFQEATLFLCVRFFQKLIINVFELSGAECLGFSIVSFCQCYFCAGLFCCRLFLIVVVYGFQQKFPLTLVILILFNIKFAQIKNCKSKIKPNMTHLNKNVKTVLFCICIILCRWWCNIIFRFLYLFNLICVYFTFFKTYTSIQMFKVRKFFVFERNNTSIKH